MYWFWEWKPSKKYQAVQVLDIIPAWNKWRISSGQQNIKRGSRRDWRPLPRVNCSIQGSTEEEKEDTKFICRAKANCPRNNSTKLGIIKKSQRPKSWAVEKLGGRLKLWKG